MHTVGLRLVSAAVAVLLAPGLVLAAPAPARADSQVSHDSAKDALKFFFGDGTTKRVRRDKTHDIVRSRAAYGGGKLVLSLDVRALARNRWIASWYLKTSNGRWWVHHDKRKGPAYTSLFVYGGPEVLDCDGLRGRADRRRDRVTVVVPRGCIDAPQWVRFGSSMGLDTNDWAILDDGRMKAGFLATTCRLGGKIRYG
ncbi:hypothetical protein HNR19_000001 [Nocardioides thalensis]|uniref:Uncharacterized protein n=1 Tax=Nocardioides thalensis TaxID=1914755 RepID=A0A853BYS7_9ACTN|nr:hypothetical protein [Nocardioides thalensis]NYI99302.1 hypothetical protein [Nocardioides thalensis]